MTGEPGKWIAPCGLYFGICPDNIIEHDYPGCGCEKVDCAASWHHDHCLTWKCSPRRELDGRWECHEMPCTQFVQFSVDLIWRTHLPVIENLRRMRQIGPALWLEEQAAYWASERYRDRWLRLCQECSQRHPEWTHEE